MRILQELYQCAAPVALVTGSGSPRVGRAIAMELSNAGCRLAIHANTSVDLAQQVADATSKASGHESIVVTGSLTEDTVPDRIVSETMEAFDRIDVLVNSAAIWSPTTLADITPDEIRRYFQINTLGSFLCARAAGTVMVQQPTGGSIINIGDWATVRPYLDHAAYFPSKGGVETMTRSLAVELGHRNPKVRVNCIQPGPVLLAEDVDEEHRKRISESTLTKELGTAEHVAHAVRFMCENSFVTGVCLPVDGGRSIYAPDGLQTGLNTG